MLYDCLNSDGEVLSEIRATESADRDYFYETCNSNDIIIAIILIILYDHVVVKYSLFSFFILIFIVIILTPINIFMHAHT